MKSDSSKRLFPKGPNTDRVLKGIKTKEVQLQEMREGAGLQYSKDEVDRKNIASQSFVDHFKDTTREAFDAIDAKAISRTNNYKIHKLVWRDTEMYKRNLAKLRILLARHELVQSEEQLNSRETMRQQIEEDRSKHALSTNISTLTISEVFNRTPIAELGAIIIIIEAIFLMQQEAHLGIDSSLNSEQKNLIIQARLDKISCLSAGCLTLMGGAEQEQVTHIFSQPMDKRGELIQQVKDIFEQRSTPEQKQAHAESSITMDNTSNLFHDHESVDTFSNNMASKLQYKPSSPSTTNQE